MARFIYLLWRYANRDALGYGGKDVAEGAAKAVTRRVKGLFIKAIGTLALLRLRCHSFIKVSRSCNISARP